jgi:hypothetical protein
MQGLMIETYAVDNADKKMMLLMKQDKNSGIKKNKAFCGNLGMPNRVCLVDIMSPF